MALAYLEPLGNLNLSNSFMKQPSDLISIFLSYFPGSGIEDLFPLCRPSAVPRLIVTIVVNSIKTQPRRSFAHIAPEYDKVLPFIAHSNSPSIIIFTYTRLAFFRTSSQHVIPDSVCSSPDRPVLGYYLFPCFNLIFRSCLTFQSLYILLTRVTSARSSSSVP